MRKGGKLEGWKVERLGDVCEIDKIPYRKKNLPYVGLEHIESSTGKFIGSKEPHTVKSTTFNFSDKHILYGRLRPYLKKVLQPDFEGHCSSEIFPLKVSNQLDRRFLFHWLLSDETTEKINATSTGARMPRANMNQVLDFEIPIPPLPEQQRIVSVLDEAFASIAAAKSNAERNLLNARELFESVMEEIFGNGNDWVEKKLFEIGDTQTGTTPKTSEKKNYGDYIPFIKPADIDISGDGEIRYDNEGLSETGLQNGRLMSAGSVLMVCIGASIGKVGFADRDVSCNQQINAFTVNKPNYPKFFYYALRTQGFYNKVIKNSAQATLPIINKSKWENLSIRFPESLAEQRAIVGRLEALSAETGRLEEIYQQKVELLEELKKSVLQKAFNGEL